MASNRAEDRKYHFTYKVTCSSTKQAHYGLHSTDNLEAPFVGTGESLRKSKKTYGTSYAASIADSQFRPKLKFLFRVEFLFKPEVVKMFGQETAAWAKNFAFLIRSVDRPKVDFEYDDVNMYNFRIKVLKSIKHRALTMTLMDDVGNNVHEFFRTKKVA